MDAPAQPPDPEWLFAHVATWDPDHVLAAEALIPEAEARQDQHTLGRLFYALAIRAYLDGDHERWASMLDRGLSAIDPEAHPRRFLLFLNFRAIAFMRQGAIVKAIELLTPATLRGTEWGELASEMATALANLGECYVLLGALDQADRYLARAVDVAAGIDDRWAAFQASFSRANLAFRRANLAEASRLTADAERFAVSHESEAFALRGEGCSAMLRAWKALYEGAWDVVIREAAVAEHAVSQQGDPPEVFQCIELLTRARLARGDLADAGAEAERGLILAADSPGSATYHRALRLAGAVAEARGDLRRMRELLDRATSPDLTQRIGHPASVVGHFIERHQQQARVRDEELASVNQALRRTKRALEHSRDEAIAQAEVRKQFLGQMSHELRTPLHGVIGTVELLRSTPLNPDQSELADIIRRSAKLTLGVVDDILDLGKLEAGELRLEPEPFDLLASVKDVLDTLRTRAGSTRLALHVAAGIGPGVSGEARRVQQVLMNLVGNALKYADAQEIRVEIRAGHEGIVRFDVHDDGIGIPPEALATLFNPYVQTGARRARGTGLGLAIARSLVETSGGQIGAHSTLGSGSTFWFELPLPPCELGVVGEDDRLVDLRGVRILLAEDNAVNRSIMERQLSSLGAHVIGVGDGTLAIDHALADPPDLVLMDLHMPILDGDAATRRLRGQGYAGPILALTASVLEDARQTCLEAGMNGFLTKPLESSQLLKTLAPMLVGRD